jgi:PAS domain S-box-containing protein
LLTYLLRSLCLILLLPFWVSSQLYTFRNFNHKDGLSIATVSSLHSSKDGNIWLGTDGAGLIRFNGSSFQELSDESMRHHITSISENGKNLFFTSKYKGVFVHSDEKTVQLVNSSQLKGESENVRHIGDGLFITSQKGFYTFLQNRLEIVREFDNEIHISQILELPGFLILLTNKGNFHYSIKSKRLIPLNNWIKTKSGLIDQLRFGAVDGQKVMLVNEKLNEWLEIIINENGGIYSIQQRTNTFSLSADNPVISSAFDKFEQKIVFLTANNDLILFQKNEFRKVTKNYDKEFSACTKVITDINGDIWLASRSYGLFKVSMEPFTKVLLHPEYNSPDLFCLYRSRKGDILLSKRDATTKIGNIYTNSPFVSYPFRTNSVVEFDEILLLGTDQGLYQMDKVTKQIRPFDLPGLERHKITYLGVFDGDLFIGLNDNGLVRYSFADKTKKTIQGKWLPKYIYTAQQNKQEGKIYFGTNEGIFYLNQKTSTINHLSQSSEIGYYVGISIKDIYGNLWFTGDNGLFGILRNGENVVLTDDKLFNSKLFYTLNSDNFGNLIVGTNKGLNILSMDELGNVIKRTVFTGQNGFGGYETNMRSQFQDANSIFVGTIEGLFLINTEILRKFPKPTPPIITTLVKETIDSQGNSFAFQFTTNNAKIQHLYYSYRIKGYQDEWSELSETAKILISNLPNGDFTLEVRSTYDGAVFSEPGRFQFFVQKPFWKSRWFIVGLILFVVLANILIIIRRKTFEGGNFFKTKDLLVELSMTPAVLLFSFISVVVSSYIAPLVDTEIPTILGSTVLTGCSLLFLYLYAKNEEHTKRTHHFRKILIVTYTIVISHFFFGAIVSKLHPFFVVALALSMTLVPFIFDQLRHVILQSLILIIVSVFILLFLDETVYNKYLFFLMILIASSLSIFASYLRYDSLERLIFISGVINKGNVQVISFNKEGIITYASENINDIIPTTHAELLNKQISILNEFLPDEGKYRSVDLTAEFFDGKKYLVPMLSQNGDVHWIEWSCKVFSERVKIIMGQNVSERMELENTYELLVENAEDLIYQTDVEGVLQFMNKQFIRSLGYDAHELEGKNSLFLVHPEYKREVLDYYQDHFKQKAKSSYLEFPVVSKTGKTIWIGQHVTTVFKQGRKGFISGFLALARDITQKREQQQTIQEQRDNITSSIRYAQRIQLNLQPDAFDFGDSFEESFVIYKPKDIVSGDFYWIQRIENKTILALADCTGHGVPGAFMTLLGMNLLNSIIIENRITEASEILNQMDQRLIHTLSSQQNTDNIKDGMEMTVLIYDHSNCNMQYACAGSRFLIYEENGFNMYKGDVKHIGDNEFPDFKQYVSHSLQLEPDSTIYLLTDGFQDQFGGNRDKKFSFRRVLETFEENIRLPLSEQQHMIESEFDRWRQDIEQTDDVTVIALRNPKK